MSRIGEFFKRIRNSIFNRNNVPQIGAITRDTKLESELSLEGLEYFENPNNFNEYCQAFFNENRRNFQEQYDYVDLISQMQANGAMDDYKKYLQYINENPGLYYPSQVHGVAHTSRVVLFAEMLCMLDSIPEHEKHLIMVAAQLHDIGREDDAKNFDHGVASKEKIENLGLLRNFDPRDREIIEFAISCHSLEPDQIEQQLKTIPKKDRADYKKILDYLQDADKLDRTRIANKGWGLDPHRLASNTAKKLVKVAHQNYYEYFKMMDYQEKREKLQNMQPIFFESFEEIKRLGFNISIDDFRNIVSEYTPGTLEMLKSQGRIRDIFSYDTFQKYRIPESFEDRISVDRINPDDLFSKVTEREQTSLMRETFNSEFMLYYNLEKNNPDAFDLLCYVDIDKSAMYLAGIANEVRLSDLEKLNSNGNNFRLNDLFLLASNLTPEEYKEVIRSGNIQDLYSSKYVKDASKIQRVRTSLAQQGIYIDEKTFQENFRLIEEISGNNFNILAQPGIEKYSYQELFCAITKLGDASFRIRNGKTDQFFYNDKTVIDLIEYSRSTKVLESVSEDEQLDIVKQFAINSEYVKHPRFIEYTLKKNKPYVTKEPIEVLNYVLHCSNKILEDPNISLGEAKSKLVNAMFNIDVPPMYRKEFEKEMVEVLYYHQKYLSDSAIEQDCVALMSSLREMFSCGNIKDFKDLLYENRDLLNFYNTSTIGNMMKQDLSRFSKKDIVSQLQKTAKQIESMQTTQVVATNGKVVNAKVFSGQEFNLAVSTAMPKCSSTSHKIRKSKGESARDEIYNIMLHRPIVPQEICTSLTSNEFLAHAASALQDQELIFAYVPENLDNISVAAMYDLSTTRNNEGKRITQKPTTARSYKDMIAGSTEEHNEAVISNTYPRYIVCYDQITDIAVNKKEALEQEYKRNGIDQPIDILLIDAKGTYIPKIKEQIENEHETIREKLLTGRFTRKDFAEMFEKHESNFVLRTLQAIHSTSFRDDIWDDTYNFNILNSMTSILEGVSRIVEPEKARKVLDQVNILIQRSDRSTEYGYRFYDHTYAKDIDVQRLGAIKEELEQTTDSYESGKNLVTRSNDEQKIIDEAPDFV